MTTDPQTDPRVKNLRDAQRRLRSVLIANADRLDKPFTDDPDKSPWDTYVRPAMRELKSAVDAIAAPAAAVPVVAPPVAVDSSEDRCAECGHFRGAHEEAEEPVSVGRCTVCADEDEWHDFEAVEAEQAGGPSRETTEPQPETQTGAHRCGNCEGIDPDSCLTNMDRPAVKAQQAATKTPDEAPDQWCKCRSCWGWFVEDHPGEDLDELGRNLGWWSGLPEHRDAPAVSSRPGTEQEA